MMRNGCSNTGGLKYALVVPSGAAFMATFQGMAASQSAQQSGVLSAAGTLSATLNAVSNQNGWTRISGTVVNGETTGTVKLQFASTTAGQTSTVYANSNLTARKI